MWFNIKKRSAQEFSAETRKKAIKGTWEEVMSEVNKVISQKFENKEKKIAKLAVKAIEINQQNNNEK